MSIMALLGTDEVSAELPASGRTANSESDSELSAMLSRAAEDIGLKRKPPPNLEHSRLGDWFLGAGRNS